MISAKDVRIVREGKTVIDSLTVYVEPGKIQALIGPNGSGKSTALRAISGEAEFFHGEIFYGGLDVKNISIATLATQRAVVSQSLKFGLSFKVKEVMSMAIRYHGTAASAQSAVESLKIEKLWNRPVTSLSGGEQQRVAIAMALAQSTPYLLLDEPFSAQDIESVDRITHLVSELAQGGVGILLVAHMRKEDLKWCDEVTQLDVRSA